MLKTIMLLDIFIVIIALIWLVFASISDIKKREVPDWLNFSLIAIGIFVYLIQSLLQRTFYPLIYSFLSLFLFFIIVNLMYYTKQWGGGDAKLLIGLGALFPIYPNTLFNFLNPIINTPFPIILFLNILFIGAIYGIVYSIYLSTKHKKEFFKELSKILKERRFILLRKVSLFLIVVLIFLLIIIDNNLIKLLLGALILLILLLIYLIIFIRAVENVCMIKKIPISKLTPGDWVMEDIRIKNKLIYSSKSYGIQNYQISQLKKQKIIKFVVIKEGMPFVPSFLIAFILSIIFGNFLVPL